MNDGVSDDVARYAKMKKTNKHTDALGTCFDIALSVGLLIEQFDGDAVDRETLKAIITSLRTLAQHYDLTLDECWTAANDKNAKRNNVLVNGVAVRSTVKGKGKNDSFKLPPRVWQILDNISIDRHHTTNTATLRWLLANNIFVTDKGGYERGEALEQRNIRMQPEFWELFNQQAERVGMKKQAYLRNLLIAAEGWVK